jgi:hypothetical protein
MSKKEVADRSPRKYANEAAHVRHVTRQYVLQFPYVLLRVRPLIILGGLGGFFI